MSDAPGEIAPRGQDPITHTVCQGCGSQTAFEVYRYFATVVMFCTTCESSWTAEAAPEERL